MRNDKVKVFFLIIPSLGAGGMEKVMTLLCKYFSENKSEIFKLILLTKQNQFFQVPSNIQIIEPKFSFKKSNRFLILIKTIFYLRKQFKIFKPHSFLSFGGRFNSFVILSSLGFKVKRYISERSNPKISYGVIIDFINKFFYSKADILIAQTHSAKEVFQQKYKVNIKVISNPIEINFKEFDITYKENIIVNAGRFIKTKNQIELVTIFARINNPYWRLIFIGDGPELNNVRNIVKLNNIKNIEFIGNTNNVNSYLRRAKIFAFTSLSEGFPNVLLEAMVYGCSIISYDCECGPKELLNFDNGILINVKDQQSYINSLKSLMEQDKLRLKFVKNGFNIVERFGLENIGEEYFKVLSK